MALEREIEADLAANGGTKQSLVAAYGARQAILLALHGGNISDIPVDKDNEYWQIGAKLQAINRMQLPDLTVPELEASVVQDVLAGDVAQDPPGESAVIQE